MRKLLTLGLILALFISLAGTASALVVSTYTDITEWMGAVDGNFAIEDFNDAQLEEGVSYVSSESGGINTKFGYYHDVLASYSKNSPQTIWTFETPITAYGGTWTLGGPGGSGNSLQVYIHDVNHYVGYISNSYNKEFWGFISDTPFTQVLLVGGTGSNQQIYKLDDMVYSMVGSEELENMVFSLMSFNEPSFKNYAVASSVAATPVPPSALLLGTGLLGLVAWRRFRKS
jgi:hypothetical protein